MKIIIDNTEYRVLEGHIHADGMCAPIDPVLLDDLHGAHCMLQQAKVSGYDKLTNEVARLRRKWENFQARMRAVGVECLEADGAHLYVATDRDSLQSLQYFDARYDKYEKALAERVIELCSTL